MDLMNDIDMYAITFTAVHETHYRREGIKSITSGNNKLHYYRPKNSEYPLSTSS